jgi:hypothetical protein
MAEAPRRKKARRSAGRGSALFLFERVASYLAPCLSHGDLKSVYWSHPTCSTWFMGRTWWAFALQRSRWAPPSRDALVRLMDAVGDCEVTSPELHPNASAFDTTTDLHVANIIESSGQGGHEYAREFIQRKPTFRRTVHLLEHPVSLSLTRHPPRHATYHLDKIKRPHRTHCLGYTSVEMFDESDYDGVHRLSTLNTWHCVNLATGEPEDLDEFSYKVGGSFDEESLLTFGEIGQAACPTCGLCTYGGPGPEPACCWCLHAPTTASPSQVCLSCPSLPPSIARRSYLHAPSLSTDDPDFQLWSRAIGGHWSSVTRVCGDPADPATYRAVYTSDEIFVRVPGSSDILTIPHPSTLPQFFG